MAAAAACAAFSVGVTGRDDQQAGSLLGQQLPDRSPCGGLAGTGRALHDGKLRIASQHCGRGPLPLIQPYPVIDGELRQPGGLSAAGGEPHNQLSLNV